MDNLTHSLVGLAAAKAGLERVSPYATLLCVVAANLPDADVVTLAGGGLTYLKHHRGITHSIVGTLALGVLLPVVFYACERLVARARGRRPRARLGGLLVASLLVIATHPLLDWTNSYGLRPFLPWSGRWYYGDLVFVIDPWLWLLLGGACFLLTATGARRVALWAVLALVVCAAVLFAPQRGATGIPLALRVLWVACVAALAFAHRAKLGARGGASIASAALAAVVVYWCALALLQSRALGHAGATASRLAAPAGETSRRVAAMPLPMNPLRWSCVAETDAATYRYEVSLGGPGEEARASDASRFVKPFGPDALLVGRVAAEDVRAGVFLDFARFPVTQVRRETQARAFVRITDVRFGDPPGEGRDGPGNFTIEFPVAAP